MFIRLLSVCTISFGQSLVSNLKRTIKCVCQTRPTVVNINSDEALYHPFTVNVNKCDRGCNIIDDP